MQVPQFILALLAALVLIAILVSEVGIFGQKQPTDMTTSMILNPDGFNFINLTGVGKTNVSSGKLVEFWTVNNVSGVSTSINTSRMQPGGRVLVNVTFTGTFDWYSNRSRYYLASPLINVHYFGVELGNQTNSLYVQNSAGWISLINSSQVLTPKVIGDSSLLVSWIVTPSASDAGKKLKFCGGYFASYQNYSGVGGWNTFFYNLSYSQSRMVNASVINIPASSCATLEVA